MIMGIKIETDLEFGEIYKDSVSGFEKPKENLSGGPTDSPKRNPDPSKWQ
jgi:hypothetical protein